LELQAGVVVDTGFSPGTCTMKNILVWVKTLLPVVNVPEFNSWLLGMFTYHSRIIFGIDPQPFEYGSKLSTPEMDGFPVNTTNCVGCDWYPIFEPQPSPSVLNHRQ